MASPTRKCVECGCVMVVFYGRRDVAPGVCTPCLTARMERDAAEQAAWVDAALPMPEWLREQRDAATQRDLCDELNQGFDELERRRDGKGR